MPLVICVDLYCCVEVGWGRIYFCRILVVLSQDAKRQGMHTPIMEIVMHPFCYCNLAARISLATIMVAQGNHISPSISKVLQPLDPLICHFQYEEVFQKLVDMSCIHPEMGPLQQCTGDHLCLEVLIEVPIMSWIFVFSNDIGDRNMLGAWDGR